MLHGVARMEDAKDVGERNDTLELVVLISDVDTVDVMADNCVNDVLQGGVGSNSDWVG